MVEYVAHRHSKELKQRQRRRQQEREKNAVGLGPVYMEWGTPV